MTEQKKDPHSKTRKFKFVALFLPIAGLLLILPPLVSMRRDVDAVFLGVPINIAYLFAVWMFLIIGAYFLQRNIPTWPTPKNKPVESNRD